MDRFRSEKELYPKGGRSVQLTRHEADVAGARPASGMRHPPRDPGSAATEKHHRILQLPRLSLGTSSGTGADLGDHGLPLLLGKTQCG